MIRAILLAAGESKRLKSENKLIKNPPANEHPDRVAKYINTVFLPNIFHIVEIVAALVAGPDIRNTNAAPGDKPFIINANAIGTDAVAQT